MKTLGKILAITGLITLVPISARGENPKFDTFIAPEETQPQKSQDAILGNKIYHRATQGESAFSLARKYFNSQSAAYKIAKDNGDLFYMNAKGELISGLKVGDIVVMPLDQPETIKYGEAFDQIAKRNKITTEKLLEDNPWLGPFPAQGEIYWIENNTSKKEAESQNQEKEQRGPGDLLYKIKDETPQNRGVGHYLFASRINNEKKDSSRTILEGRGMPLFEFP